MSRAQSILLALGALLARLALARLHLVSAEDLPQHLRRTLERLGTTFIKLGQMLSLRRDLLPEAYLAALQDLQDHVPPFPASRARQTIEASLGAPIGELFAELEDTPLGAASIAQVHRARLPDGREVVVKVRRPGIREAVRRDMLLLRRTLRVATLVLPPLRRLRAGDLLAELEANLLRELDFREEARNIRRFAEAFAGSETVYVPEAVSGMVREDVLVQAMSGGRRVDDASLTAEEGRELAEAFLDAYLRQFFVLGVFHGDPHPGNLFIRDDSRICFHDFGLVGHLSRDDRRALGGFMQAFRHQDPDWLLDSYLDLGILAGDLDRAEFRQGLEELLRDYAGRPLAEWSLAEAFMRLARLGRGQNIRLPHRMLVFMRALFLIETTIRQLDPEFDLLHGLVGKARDVLQEESEAWWRGAAADRVRYEAALLFQDAPGALARGLRQARQSGGGIPVSHRGLGDFERHMDRGANRLALALVTLGLFIAASLLMQHSIGPRLGSLPVLALAGYVLALWFTFRLVRAIGRADDL